MFCFCFSDSTSFTTSYMDVNKSVPCLVKTDLEKSINGVKIWLIMWQLTNMWSVLKRQVLEITNDVLLLIIFYSLDFSMSCCILKTCSMSCCCICTNINYRQLDIIWEDIYEVGHISHQCHSGNKHFTRFLCWNFVVKLIFIICNIWNFISYQIVYGMI